MMRRVAQSLDALVETLPALRAALKNASAVNDAAFKRLLEKSGRPKLAKKSDTVSPEYAKALVAAAIVELKKLQRFAESDDVADEFPEMVDEGAEDEASTTTEEGDDDAHTIEEGSDDGLGSEEPEVEVTIDGDGVEVVHGEDSKLYMILPDNSVLKMEEASEREAKVARFLLSEQKSATAEKPAEPKKMPADDPEAEEKKAKDEAEKIREQSVKDSAAERYKVRTDSAIRKETQASAGFVHPASRRSVKPLTQTRKDQSSRKS
jgi:Arc/MetJ family transcription regulator